MIDFLSIILFAMFYFSTLSASVLLTVRHGPFSKEFFKTFLTLFAAHLLTLLILIFMRK